MAEQLVTNDNLKFESGLLKGFMRDFLLTTIVNNFSLDKTLSGLTLPGTSFQFERDFINYYPDSKLIGLEYDLEKFNQGKKIIDAFDLNKNIALYNQSDLEYFNNNKNKFDFLWLDYCGPFSNDKKLSIESILKNDCLNFDNGNPLLGLTLSATYDFPYINEIMMFSEELNFRKMEKRRFFGRLGGIPKYFNEMFNDYNKTLHLKTVIYYKDNVRNSSSFPMIFWVFDVFDGIHDFDIWHSDAIQLKSDTLFSLDGFSTK